MDTHPATFPPCYTQCKSPPIKYLCSVCTNTSYLYFDMTVHLKRLKVKGQYTLPVLTGRRHGLWTRVVCSERKGLEV